MRIEFTKMHGLGNDFMVFDLPPDAPLPTPDQWRALANRHTGIGFDQALVLQPPRRHGTDAFYRVFNADGGEVEQCGNGARCIAALVHRRNGHHGDTVAIDCIAGLMRARVLPGDLVSIDLGVPNFDPRSLPFDVPAQNASYRIAAGGEIIDIGAVQVGNPHAVLHVESVDDAPVERIGRALQSNPHFPRQVNVGFMQVMDTAHIRLRVYERGVGETLACGTGSCAAAVVGHHLGLLGTDVEVHVPGGKLSVHWGGPGQSVWLTGPAQRSFEGRVEI
jgi:diaminopimelate epimerase